MSMRLSDYEIDVWFLYGSFAYGAEASVRGYAAGELVLAMRGEAGGDAAETEAFFDQLIQDPKGLIRCEIRVFAPAGTARAAGLPDARGTGALVTLSTVVAPSGIPGPGEGVLLRFSHLAPSTAADRSAWLELTSRIWPRLPR